MTTDQRVRIVIGDLVIANEALKAQVEELQAKIEALQSEKKPEAAS